MACGACARKAAARKASQGIQQVPLPASINQQPPVAPRPDDDTSEYVTKRYIGPKQKVTSKSNLLSYGVRNYGEVLIILRSDAEDRPDLWEDV